MMLTQMTPVTAQSPTPEIHVHTFRAMGSQITIWLELDDAQRAYALLAEAETLFTQNEAILTRFDERSELMQLNAQPETWVPVSLTLWNVIEKALKMAAHTQGAFDPTVLTALQAAGYTQTFDALSAATANNSPPLATSTWADVSLNPQQHTVWLPPGCQLDLGGVGKGYTAQRVVEWLSNYGPCLVNAGGDITAGDPPSRDFGWYIGIAPPGIDTNQPDLLYLWLRNATLATSGIDYRVWQQGDAQQHHIIDPQTNAPAKTDLLSVSVLTATASVAEGLATAALVLGHTAAYELLCRNGMAAALVQKTGEVTLTPLMAQIAISPKTTVL